MYGYIYKITNLLNQKIYIGQHKCKKWDPHYYGNGRLIKQAIKKEGLKNFRNELIQEAYNKSELDSLERFWIKKLKSQDPKIGYNLADGGNDGNQDQHWCTNGIIEIQYRDTLPEGFHPGRLPMSEQQRNKLKRPKSKIHKRNLSKARKGRIWVTNGEEDRCCNPKEIAEFEANGFYKGRTGGKKFGPKHSTESKKKIGLAQKGTHRSAELRQRISKKVRITTSDPEWKKRHSQAVIKGSTVRGKHWYHNANKQKRFYHGEQPEGWVIGQLSKNGKIN